MINVILIIGEAILSYLSIYLLYKKYKNNGIYIYAIVATIGAIITSLKKISILEIGVPVGFSLVTSLITCGNLITESNKKEELRNYVTIIFLTGIITASLLNLSGLMISSEVNYITNEAYNNVFNYNIMTYLGLIMSMIVSILIGSKIYNTLRKSGNKLGVSNIYTTIIVTLIENVIFIFLAFLGEFEILEIIICILFRYIIKVVIGIIGTIPLYIINKENK